MTLSEAAERLGKYGLSRGEAISDLLDALQIAQVESIDSLIEWAELLSTDAIRDTFGMRAGRVVVFLIDPDDEDGSGVREPRRPLPISGCGLELPGS